MNGLTPQRHERQLLLLALASVVEKRGYDLATPEAVAAEAKLPLTAFEREFASVEDCFLELYDNTVDGLTSAVDSAVEQSRSQSGRAGWRLHLDAGFAAVLEFLSALPTVTHACVVEGAAVGPAVVSRRNATLQGFMDNLEGVRRSRGEHVPPLTVEMIVGGTYELIYSRVARGETERLPDLLPELRYVWLSPFLGCEDELGGRSRRFRREPPPG
jgi:AcrR family transcriptional regulator